MGGLSGAPPVTLQGSRCRARSSLGSCRLHVGRWGFPFTLRLSKEHRGQQKQGLRPALPTGTGHREAVKGLFKEEGHDVSPQELSKALHSIRQ